MYAKMWNPANFPKEVALKTDDSKADVVNEVRIFFN